MSNLCTRDSRARALKLSKFKMSSTNYADFFFFDIYEFLLEELKVLTRSFSRDNFSGGG